MAGEAFRTRIVALRTAHGLSQEELAGVIGVTKGAVQGWESGASMPRGGHLAVIGQRFPGWSIDYLLGMPGATAPPAATNDAGASIRGAAGKMTGEVTDAPPEDSPQRRADDRRRP